MIHKYTIKTPQNLHLHLEKHLNGSKYDENGCYCIKYDVISELYTVFSSTTCVIVMISYKYESQSSQYIIKTPQNLHLHLKNTQMDQNVMKTGVTV